MVQRSRAEPRDRRPIDLNYQALQDAFIRRAQDFLAVMEEIQPPLSALVQELAETRDAINGETPLQLTRHELEHLCRVVVAGRIERIRDLAYKVRNATPAIRKEINLDWQELVTEAMW